MKKFTLILLLLLETTLIAAPVGSRFSYQGQLQLNDMSVTGQYDLKFEAWSEETAGSLFGSSLVLEDIEVINGLFSVELDFGDMPFSGDDVFLRIQVREGASTGAYTGLYPRQRINAAPYAVQADFLAPNGATTGQILEFDGTNWVAANVGSSVSPWFSGFGGAQYIGDVVIGDLVASAGDTLQILSEVDESPLRILVGGEGTRFRVSKNGGTGIGANYSDGQIPDDGLRVSGKAVIGSLGTSSPSKVTIGADNGVEPLRARIGGATKFLINANGGTTIGGGTTQAADNGLRVAGDTTIGSPSSSAKLTVSSNSGQSPLRTRINGTTKFMIQANGGTNIGGGGTVAPENGLLVKGAVFAESRVEIGDVNFVPGSTGVFPSLLVNSHNPLEVQVDGTTRLEVSEVGGVGIGGNNGFNIPQNGLYVNGDTKLDSDLILTGEARQDISSHGFAKAGLRFYCSQAPVTFNSFNNVNSSSVQVAAYQTPEHAPLFSGLCSIEFPFSISALFIQARVDAQGGALSKMDVSCRKLTGNATTLACKVRGSANVNTSVVTLLLF